MKRSFNEDVHLNKVPAKRSRSHFHFRSLAKPLGNLLLQSKPYNSRNPGLGHLAALPDEIVASIFSDLTALDAVRCQGVSQAFFAFSRIEGHWKLEYIKRSRGALTSWKGSWRSTYINEFMRSPEHGGCLSTDSIEIRDLFSDVLYLPHLASSYDANDIANASSFTNNIVRRDGRLLSGSDLGQVPMILTGVMRDWPAFCSTTSQRWSFSSLASRFPCTNFRAEAVLVSMRDYITYHNACGSDENPLYIFDAKFVENTRAKQDDGGLGADYNTPRVFLDDLFKVLGPERPDYRWLVSYLEKKAVFANTC